MDIPRIHHLLARRSELVSTFCSLVEQANGQGSDSTQQLEQDIAEVDEQIFQELATGQPALAEMVIQELERESLLN